MLRTTWILLLLINAAMMAVSTYGRINAGVSQKYQVEPFYGATASAATLERVACIKEEIAISSWLIAIFATNVIGCGLLAGRAWKKK